VLRSHLHRNRRRALGALLAAVLSIGVFATLIGPAAADPSVPASDAQITFTNTTNLHNTDLVTYQVTTSGTQHLFAVTAHICDNGATQYTAANFGYVGASQTRCVDGGAGQIVSGALTGGDYEKSNSFGGTENDSGIISFKAGTGDVTWVNDTGHGPTSLTCDSTHPCKLVVKADLTGSPTPVFFTQQLTYAAPSNPGPVLGVAVTAGDQQLSVSWNTQILTGERPIDHYVVTYTGTATCGGGCTFDAGTSTSAVITTSVQNFDPYNVTVHAHNDAGFTGAESSVVGPRTPLPAVAPAIVTMTPGDQQLTVGWTAPPFTGPPALDGYRLRIWVGTSTAGAPAQEILLGNVLSTVVTPLTNGQTYSFKVGARYQDPNFGPDSAAAQGTPQLPGQFITQDIDVTRPSGALVLSQRCAGSPTDVLGFFDASNSQGQSGALLNTQCPVHLSGPRARPDRIVHDAVTNGTTTITSATANFVAADIGKAIEGDNIPAGATITAVGGPTSATMSVASTPIPYPDADSGPNGTLVVYGDPVTPAKLLTSGPHRGQFLTANGWLREVTVTDDRNSDVGWTVTGQIGDFSAGAGPSLNFDGDNAGWQPSVGFRSLPATYPGGAYAMSVTQGGPVIPADTNALNPHLQGSVVLPAGTAAGTSRPGSTLAFANATEGLGLAQLDAFMTVWIPVSNDSGTYHALLTLTVI
jgi:hypothetical protein